MSGGAEAEVVPEPEAPDEVAAPLLIAAAADARAVAGIRRSKGWGGLAGFAVTALGAHLHGELLSSLLLRALLGGIAGYMVAWLAAVTVWRRILRAELHRGFELHQAARAAAFRSDAQ